MKTILKTAVALAVGFTMQANAFADKGHGQSNTHVNQVSNTSQVKLSNQTTTIQKQVNTTFVNPTKKGPSNGGIVKQGNGVQQFKQYQSTGKYASYKTFTDYKGPCYQGKHCNFYTTHCWNESYGCNLYWCPTDYCWFYWCQPHGCYLPIEYVPCGSYVFAE